MTRRTWQAARAALAAALLVPALALISPTAALACSCADIDMEERIGYMDVVAAGTLTAVDTPEEPTTSQDPEQGWDEGAGPGPTYTATLETVYSGNPDNPLVFGSGMYGSDCGLNHLQVGYEYVFFILDGESNLCDGTAPLTANLVAEIEAVTGPGVQAPVPSEPSSEVAQVQEGEQQPAADEPAVPVLLALAAGLAAVAGWLFWRRRSHDSTV